MRNIRSNRCLLSLCGVLLAALSLSGEPGSPAPQGQKPFPPLQVPEGFEATLFARDPLIEYPSVIARGPRPGSLFVAVDYLTGLGTSLDRHDEVRLIEDTDGDGRADRSTVYASGLNCIQGLAYHAGTLYVMHAPYLSALRDTKGAGKADERRDLLEGLGLAPEEDQIRLHNANGVVPGHDGWLYLALGDRGCDVRRPEGDRLVLEGGGILRCRPDGRDLHVFSTGLRNIYDVALDEELNVFTRDNENDGGAYKIRVCHSFFGADHGYPYLYMEHPDEALAPLADLGLGSSAGGVCYLEPQFPPAYRGGLLFCEWGRSVVHYPLKRSGPSFARDTESDFAAGAPGDPYGFKPTDLVVDRDGSLFISDWADGQRPRRGRGRIYRVRHVGKEPGAVPAARGEDPISLLDSESHTERCQAQQALEGRGKEGVKVVTEALTRGKLGVRGRLHAVWILAKVEGAGAIERLFALAREDADPRVQAQAVRAIADLADPVLTRHRLSAGRGDAALARRLASLADGRDARVRLEVVIALGRLRWAEAPAWLGATLKEADPALAHAAMWALRQGGSWPAVLKLLDESGSETLRAVALRALAGRYDAELVDGMIEKLRAEQEPARRLEYADALSRVHRRPAPWTYWGFSPRSRPANTVAWERTGKIEQALDHALAASDRAGALEILRRMVREKVPARGKTIGRWLTRERDTDTVALLLAGLAGQADGATRPLLEGIVKDRRHTASNRLLAASLFLESLDGDSLDRLPAVAERVEDGAILAELLRAIGTRRARQGSQLLVRKLSSPAIEVRVEAVTALAELGLAEGREQVSRLLDDSAPRVRAAAALAAGRLKLRGAADRLLGLAADPEPEVRRACLEALRQLREPRALAVALAGLNDGQTTASAIRCVGELGGPASAGALAELARRQPSSEVLATVGKVLLAWAGQDSPAPGDRQKIERALAGIHGSSGILLAWHVLGPLQGEASERVEQLRQGRALPTGERPAPGWRLFQASATEARVRLEAETPGTWLGYSEVFLDEPASVECFAASTAPLTVWLNGKVVHQRDRPSVPGPYPERFEAALEKGLNRVVVRLTGVKTGGDFLLRFRRRSANPQRERYARASLSRAGNPAAGRKVFLDGNKSLCIKCHRVGDVGERVGPELTGLGGRFPKPYIIESILEPGRTISPSFETTLLALTSGKVLQGIKTAENDTTITLVDSQTMKHVIARSDIEEETRLAVSTMPEGLEKLISEDELVDLVSFLVSLKETAPPKR